MTLRDYARAGQFMLEGGKAGKVQVLPPTWLAEATSPLVISTESATYPGYGYYWRSSKDAFAATGYAGQRIIVYPENKVVIAVNSAFPNPQALGDSGRPNPQTQAENGRNLDAFVEALHAAAVAQPVGPVRDDFCTTC